MLTKIFAEKVLVVDDDPSIVEFLKLALEREGLLVATASDGTSGLQSFQEQPIFAVISDYKMPNMDGLELCRLIRQSNSSVPFVVLSGVSDRASVLTGMRVGATEFIDKPADLAKLISLIKNYRSKREEHIKQEMFELETIKNIFIDESKTILSNLDEIILAIEDDPNNKEEINKLFRKIHTLKGSSASVQGGQRTSELAHSFENLLSAVKDSKMKLKKNHVDLMLVSIDRLKQCIEAIDQGSTSPDAHDLIDRFKLALESPDTVVEIEVAKNAGNVPAKKTEEVDEGVTVSNEKLDHFMELAGELVAFKNVFYGFVKQRIATLHLDEELQDMNKSLAKLTEDLQNQIMDIRKISLQKAFAKFPRVVRQIAQDLNKSVKYETVGLDLQVDKTIAKSLAASLIHVVRNACDHGIETIQKRKELGKSESGLITITAAQTADIVRLCIQDNGAGLDRNRIYNKALSKGLISVELQRMTDNEVFELLFLPGFSTAETVSDLSGRGVGMDVVKTAVTALGGHAHFESVLGQSTSLIINVPVPRSIMVEQSIVACSNDMLIAIPLSCISEIKPVHSLEFTYIYPFWMIEHNGKTVPIASYQELLSPQHIDRHRFNLKKDELIVVIVHKDKHFALRIDAIKDQLEAVVRPFDKITQAIPGFKGTSQLPGDELAYMVSSEDFIRLVTLQNSQSTAGQAA